LSERNRVSRIPALGYGVPPRHSASPTRQPCSHQTAAWIWKFMRKNQPIRISRMFLDKEGNNGSINWIFTMFWVCLSTSYLFIYLFIYLLWYWGLNLGLCACYHLSYASSTFFFGYFWDRVSLFPWLAWTTTMILLFILPAVAGMTGTCHGTQFFSLRLGSQTFFPGLDWNHDLPNLHLLSSWDDRSRWLHPAIG
jgi:hypothetical protein